MKLIAFAVLTFLFHSFFIFNPTNSLAQNSQRKNIELKVINSEDSSPILNYSVKVDSIEYSLSESHSNFSINTFPKQIIVSSQGFISKELNLSGRSSYFVVHLIPENINIQEILVSAFESSEKLLEANGSIELISNKRIVNEPTFNLAPILNKVSGIWMQSGSYNTNRLTIRGIGSRSQYSTNKIRAYFGDIPITNGAGESTFEDIETDEISTIEIVKGPASGFYGSGLGGVLLFKPKKPNANQVMQKVEVGSFNTIKSLTKASYSENNFSNSLVYSKLNSEGYRENNQTSRHNVLYLSSYSKNNTVIDVITSAVRTEAFIPSSVDEKGYNESPEKAASSWEKTRGYEDYKRVYAGLSIKQSLLNNWLFSTSIYGFYNKNNELRPFNILKETSNYYGFRSYIRKKLYVGNISAGIIVGNEYFNEKYNWQTYKNMNRSIGDKISDNKEKRFYNNTFVSADIDLSEKLNILSSLNTNTTSYNYSDLFLQNGDQSGKHQFNPIFSPRVSIIYKPTKNYNVYSTVSQGFSPPTLEETLVPGGSRNLDIKPETGWNYELGIRYLSDNSLIIGISAYYMQVSDLLVSKRMGDDEYLGVNAGKTIHPGIEFNFDYRVLNKSSWKSFFRMNASLNDYRFSEFIDNGKDFSGNKLTGIASNITNWALESQHNSGFFFNLNVQTVGKIPIKDDNSIYSDSYNLSGFMTGFERNFKNLIGGIYFGVQNFTNTKYASMLLINAVSTGTQLPRYYYPGLPINFKAGLNIKYSF